MFGKKKKDDSKSNKLQVKIVTYNPGQPTEHYGLATEEKNGKVIRDIPLHYAPKWKTKKGAENWAKKNGYAVTAETSPRLSNAKPKPAAKRSEPKPAAAPKKAPAAKKTGTDKLLKHSDKDEMKISAVKPIIINGKNIKPKSAPKVLHRVARTGGYTAWDARTGKTFAAEKEANDYAADVLKKTGKIVPVSPTDRQVTHTFKAEEKKANK